MLRAEEALEAAAAARAAAQPAFVAAARGAGPERVDAAREAAEWAAEQLAALGAGTPPPFPVAPTHLPTVLKYDYNNRGHAGPRVGRGRRGAGRGGGGGRGCGGL